MAISWDDNLKTGIDNIDEQHRLLFETIKKLDEFKNFKKNFYEVLYGLQSYLSEHFSEEEQLMEKIDYPEYSAHKASHNMFTDNCKSILDGESSDEDFSNVATNLVAFAESWLNNHYKDDDVKLASYINK